MPSSAFLLTFVLLVLSPAWELFSLYIYFINPLVPGAQYCVRQDKLATLQNKLLKHTANEELAHFYTLHPRNQWVKCVSKNNDTEI